MLKRASGKKSHVLIKKMSVHKNCTNVRVIDSYTRRVNNELLVDSVLFRYFLKSQHEIPRFRQLASDNQLLP